MPELVLDYEASKFWLDVLKIIGGSVAFVLTWYVTFYRRRKANHEAIVATIKDNKESADEAIVHAKENIREKLDGIKSDLASTDQRLAALEKEVAGMPGHKEMGDLYAQVNAVHGDLREVMGKIGGLATSFDTVQKYLLNKGDSK